MIIITLLKMIFAVFALQFFYKDNTKQNKKSLLYAVLCLCVVAFMEFFHTIKELIG